MKANSANKTNDEKVIPILDNPKTRQFSSEYKIGILKKCARCKSPEDLNALLKSEKLHSAQLAKWWRQYSQQSSTKTQLSPVKLEPQVINTTRYVEANPLPPKIEPASELTINPREILATIWRGKWVLLTTMIIIMTLAGLLVSSMTPRYTSRALIMLENQVVDPSGTLTISNAPLDPGTMQKEMELLRSYSLINKVIKKLQLEKSAEFNPPVKEKGFFSRLTSSPEKELIIEYGESQSPYDNIPVIENVIVKEKLSLLGDSRIIELKFTAQDPLISAKIANTILETHIEDKIEQNSIKNIENSEWLTQRLATLRQNVKTSNAAIEDYRNQSGLLQSTQGLSSQQLLELNSQLIVASAERAEIQARLRQAQRLRGANIESAAAVMGSAMIQNLYDQETRLGSRLAELSTSYGNQHPKVIKLKAEKNAIQHKIDREIKKVVTNLKNEVTIASSKEYQIKAQIAALKKTVAGHDQQSAKLRVLENEAMANHEALNRFLNRHKNAEDQNKEQFQSANAKILSYATPAEQASFPKVGPIMSLCLFASIILGLLAIFIKELFSRGFLSGEQMEKATGLNSLALIPKLGGLRSSFESLEAYVQKYPASPFSEAVRSIHSNILLADDAVDRSKIIQITSAYPGEGKSTVARCLAILKRQSGLKTIIVDADMRNQEADSTFQIRSKPGLAEYLMGKAEIYQIISQDEKTGVYVIPAGRARISPSDLLPSKNMDNLLTDLAEVFDLIILDTPPVLAAPDAKILSRKVDVVAFIVKWADTRRDVVNYALKLLEDAGANQVTTALSMVDSKKHAQYSFADSGLYSGNFKRYYIGA